MNNISIEAGDSDSSDRPTEPGDIANHEASGPGMEGFKAADYCHLAEECFFLAAVTKDPEAAAELVKAGDDYLRRAAEWLADQIKSG
jgi:hypothetical protein